MPKYKIYSIRSTTYVSEVEAKDQDEAIDLFWDDKTEDIELDGSFEVKIDEVQEVQND